MMASFWIGTSGWQYRDWKERFYPKEIPQKQWLAYYCERFPTVEINNSFYMQPSEKSWDGWRETAPEGFRFAVKAHQYITHRKGLRDCEDSLERAITAARRLGPYLGPLLFQLPARFRRTEENAGRLEAFLELLPAGIDAAFEFRDKSWFVDGTFDVLRRHGVALCSFDSPKLECPLVATAAFAYIRFHGSGAAHGGNYSHRILRRWAERLRWLAKDLDDVYVYFNNDAFGHAVRNAETLSKMLEGETVQPAQEMLPAKS
jgi:uncharacterized protein YecE (DUF72 family)